MWQWEIRRESRRCATSGSAFGRPDAEAAVYAAGFAWSSHGIAPDVLDKVYAILPESLVSRLPAAQAEFEARCIRVWGSAEAGTSRTPIPNG
jgi:hypothetical protein